MTSSGRWRYRLNREPYTEPARVAAQKGGSDGKIQAWNYTKELPLLSRPEGCYTACYASGVCGSVGTLRGPASGFAGRTGPIMGLHWPCRKDLNRVGRTTCARTRTYRKSPLLTVGPASATGVDRCCHSGRRVVIIWGVGPNADQWLPAVGIGPDLRNPATHEPSAANRPIPVVNYPAQDDDIQRE